MKHWSVLHGLRDAGPRAGAGVLCRGTGGPRRAHPPRRVPYPGIYYGTLARPRCGVRSAPGPLIRSRCARSAAEYFRLGPGRSQPGLLDHFGHGKHVLTAGASARVRACARALVRGKTTGPSSLSLSLSLSPSLPLSPSPSLSLPLSLSLSLSFRPSVPPPPPSVPSISRGQVAEVSVPPTTWCSRAGSAFAADRRRRAGRRGGRPGSATDGPRARRAKGTRPYILLPPAAARR